MRQFRTTYGNSLLKSVLKLWFEKQGKHDTIWQACHDFLWQWACFSGCSIVTRFWKNVTRFSTWWVRFQDKVGRTLGRTHQPCHDLAKRDTILTVSVYYLSVSSHFWRKGERTSREENLGNQRRYWGSLIRVLLDWETL